MNLGITHFYKKSYGKQKKGNGIIFALFFFTCLFILHDLPLALDDNGFMQLSFQSNVQALHYVLGYGNGRLLGNGGIIFLLHHRPLGDFVRAFLIAGIAMLLPTILQLKRKTYFFLSMFLTLGISPGIFGQSFSWMSGFQNYVPPIFLFLCGIRLIQLPKNRNRLCRIFAYILTFLCGLCMQLYIEHSTCINFLIATLLMTYVWREKEKSAFRRRAFTFFVASFIGLLLMLIIMQLHEPAGHTSYFSGGFYGFLYGIVRNSTLLAGMFSENAIILMVIAFFHVVLLWRYKQSFSQIERITGSILLLGTSSTLLLQLIVGFRPWYGKLLLAETAWTLVILVIYIIASVIIDIRIIKKQNNKKIRVSLVLSLLSLCGVLPLLVIWPVGYRCLFHSYILLCASGLLLCDEIIGNSENDVPSKIIRFGSFSALVAIVFCLSFLFTDIRRMQSIRDLYIKEELKNGSDKIAYFTIPSPYIHDVWNDEYEHFVASDENTAQLEILPADVWFRKYYYHYS